MVVPDYMGRGKSDTPQDRFYTPGAQLDNLEALVLELDFRSFTLVLHDWGGVIGGRLALRYPDRVAHLVVLNSFLPLGPRIEAELASRNVAETLYFQ
jgi:haloalkane dehalogenase